MPTTTIRQAQTHLPHARLYLDDIVEIEDLLRKAYSPYEVTFEYIRDRKYRETSVEDLILHKGYVTEFTLEATSTNGRTEIFTVSGSHNPRFNTGYDLNEKSFDLFGRVHAIVYDRRDRFKEFCALVPAVIVLPIGSAAALVFTAAISHFFTQHMFYGRTLSVSGIVLLLCAIQQYGELRPNRVYFQRHREDVLSKSQRRSELLEKGIFMLFGAVLGVVGTIIVKHYTK